MKNVLTIFVNFLNFLRFLCHKKLMKSAMTPNISIFLGLIFSKQVYLSLKIRKFEPYLCQPQYLRKKYRNILTPWLRTNKDLFNPLVTCVH